MSDWQKISRSTGWKPNVWQKQLCEKIPPMAVYGIFRHTEYLPTRRMMVFNEAHHLLLVQKHYLKQLNDTLGELTMTVKGEA